jgi:DNA-directed RNA polymerase specialized sigma24 family protein
MKISKLFLQPSSVSQKQYEALRMYYVEQKSAAETAKKFGYKYRAFTSLVFDFKKDIDENNFSE